MMKKPEIYLGQNIRYLRKSKGLTQEEFAVSIGDITRRAVCNWEAGRREPELSNLIIIAKFFDVTLDDLVFREMVSSKPPVALYATNIKFLRKKHEIKQEDMAKFLNVSKANYSKYENGNVDIGIEKLLKLADFFGVTLDELVKQDLSKEQ